MNRQMKVRVRRPFVGDAAGSSAVEFALILPIAALMMFAFFEIGRVMWTYHIVSGAVRDAARYGARLTTICDSGGAPAYADSTYFDRVKNLARTGTINGSAAPLVPGWTHNESVSVTLSCMPNPGTYKGRYADYAQIPSIKVSATVPYSALFNSLIPGLSIGSLTVANAEPYTE